MVLSAGPKETKRRIEDILLWIEAFTVCSFVLTSHFIPHRWRDLVQYKVQKFQYSGTKTWISIIEAFEDFVRFVLLKADDCVEQV